VGPAREVREWRASGLAQVSRAANSFVAPQLPASAPLAAAGADSSWPITSAT